MYVQVCVGFYVLVSLCVFICVCVCMFVCVWTCTVVLCKKFLYYNGVTENFTPANI